MAERILKVNQLIKKELSQILLREVDFPEGVLVTLTRVESAQDLNQANVYISVLPENKIKQVLEILNRSVYFLQQKLNKRLRMRPTPKIQFTEEKQTLEAGKIEELLYRISKQK